MEYVTFYGDRKKQLERRPLLKVVGSAYGRDRAAQDHFEEDHGSSSQVHLTSQSSTTKLGIGQRSVIVLLFLSSWSSICSGNM